MSGPKYLGMSLPNNSESNRKENLRSNRNWDFIGMYRLYRDNHQTYGPRFLV